MKTLLQIWFLLITFNALATVNLYVATTGSDSNDGSIGSPFLTVGAARTALRSIDHTTQPANIWFSGGRYLITAQVDFISSDSGASAAYPVTYRAMPGETPRFVGGKVVTGWAAVTNAALLARLSASAQTNVLVADLTANGVTPTALVRYGYPISFSGFAELFCNSVPGVIARYPNTNYLHFGTVTAATNFVCSDSVPFTWTADTNIMVAGFWANDWKRSVEFVRLSSPNVSVVPVGFASTIVAGKRYFFQNVFEGLDSPGEYYFDRVNNLVYFWPPTDINSCEVIISQVTHGFFFTSVDYISFEGLTFEDFMGYAFVLHGLEEHFTNCTFRNTARGGVTASSVPVTTVLLTGCTFTDIGTSGAVLASGVRTNLITGECIVTNCVFTRMGRLDPCYSAAVSLSGVSNTVINCTIMDNPHAAVLLAGNEHRVIGNTISRMCTETSDASAIYAVLDWTFCGNVIANNVISDVRKQESAMEYHAYGVYWDGAVSGNLVFSNVFVRCDVAMFNNGGKTNFWQYNKSYFSRDFHTEVQLGATGITNTLFANRALMPYTNALWTGRYPFLTNITYSNGRQPYGSVITSNTYMNGTWLSSVNQADTFMTVTNNTELIPAAINVTSLTIGP